MAFLRDSKDILTGRQADTRGNVITLDPVANTSRTDDQAAVRTLIEHESQHVIQHYEIPDFSAKYGANPLPYEQEACARQLLKGPVTRDIYESIIKNLMQYDMDETDAANWAWNVSREREYPGVTLPRNL